ncbi:tetratricopeptide repeat protein [Massilia terrae]|uniref:Tetratricopeptide repeat protein n=1 Tax=Massilia terrae TaxID=1811224 RepID=A0ABT2CR56_9BURK|nr:tetratricopeptide repeat protein [Massilia terrae]MCS0656460.1 tetratricopeptide repeat protein [Massilia terrae]
MAYDLEEQEQIATFKAFWGSYGNLITWVLIVVLGGYAAYNFWNSHQRNQAAEASGLYDQMLASLQANDNAKVQRIAGDIESKFGGTIYAPMAALGAAKGAFDANDLKTAKAQLQWAIDHGDEEYKSLAKLRLAGVLLDEKAYDQALAQLSGEFLPQYKGDVADRKGDIYAAQNKPADARSAYQAALDAMDKKNPGRQLVQLKLDSLGGSTAAADAKPAPAAAPAA